MHVFHVLYMFCMLFIIMVVCMYACCRNIKGLEDLDEPWRKTSMCPPFLRKQPNTYDCGPFVCGVLDCLT
jgi:hypothetical protein